MPYETEADAEAVRATLTVDNELQPDKVVKKLKVEGTNLVAYVNSLGSEPTPIARSTVHFRSDTSLLLHTHPTPHSEFFATEPRLLRAAVAAFLDLLNLSTRTIEEFGHVPATFA